MKLAVHFVRALSLSAPGMCLYFSLRFSSEGRGLTRPIVVAGLLGLLCNGLLDWLLLFGHFRIPTSGCGGLRRGDFGLQPADGRHFATAAGQRLSR